MNRFILIKKYPGSPELGTVYASQNNHPYYRLDKYDTKPRNYFISEFWMSLPYYFLQYFKKEGVVYGTVKKEFYEVTNLDTGEVMTFTPDEYENFLKGAYESDETGIVYTEVLREMGRRTDMGEIGFHDLYPACIQIYRVYHMVDSNYEIKTILGGHCTKENMKYKKVFCMAHKAEEYVNMHKPVFSKHDLQVLQRTGAIKCMEHVIEE